MGKLLIDCGACVGWYVDVWLEDNRDDENLVVHCFEPLPANYDRLVLKFKDDERISVHQKALSGYSGTAKFFLKEYDDGYRDTSFDTSPNAGSSLLPGKSNVSGKNISVDVGKLSTFLETLDADQRVSTLKIDVEGSEYDILCDLVDSREIGRIDEILLEDHQHKIPSIFWKKFRFFRRMRSEYPDIPIKIQTSHVEYKLLTPETIAAIGSIPFLMSGFLKFVKGNVKTIGRRWIPALGGN